MKQKILILFLLSGVISISRCGEQIEPTNGKTFTIEYDRQVSWTCFLWGLDRTNEAFKKAETTLKIIYDDTTLTDSLVKFSDRSRYHQEHRQLDENGYGVYPGYLCGIEAFTQDDGTIIDTLAGRTWPGGPKRGWSFVCGCVAWGHNIRDKTAIHELGHQRANLTHLCLDEFNMSGNHNAPNCVMGHGEIAICTGENLTLYPEFCDYCCAEIKVIDW